MSNSKVDDVFAPFRADKPLTQPEVELTRSHKSWLEDAGINIEVRASGEYLKLPVSDSAFSLLDDQSPAGTKSLLGTRSLRLRVALLKGDNHHNTLASLVNLAIVNANNGHPRLALPLYEAACERWQSKFGHEHKELPFLTVLLATCRQSLRDTRGALPELEWAYARLREIHGEDAQLTLWGLDALLACLEELKEREDLLPLLERQIKCLTTCRQIEGKWMWLAGRALNWVALLKRHAPEEIWSDLLPRLSERLVEAVDPSDRDVPTALSADFLRFQTHFLLLCIDSARLHLVPGINSTLRSPLIAELYASVEDQSLKRVYEELLEVSQTKEADARRFALKRLRRIRTKLGGLYRSKNL